MDSAVPSFRRKGSPLKVSENSWLSQQQARRGLQTSSLDETRTHEGICRKMKGILNKLTVEKFPELSKQLVSCGIQTSSHLEMLIQEVFEKATMQHHFINMYADLCILLHIHFAENPITDDPLTNFRKILLTACQLHFEKYRAPPVSLKTLEGEELAQGEQLYKMQMLGNIRFIGALLVRKMVANKVMFSLIEEFLASPTAEALESLAALLTVVGPSFDVSEFANRIKLTVIFDKVKELCSKSETSARVRCLLQDVLDFRAASWIDRRPKKLAVPSTLEQVAQTFRAETAGADAGPFHRSVVHKRPQSSFQGTPARAWADIDAGGDVTLTQSVTREGRQGRFQGRGEEPTQKIQKMPPVSSGGAGEEPVDKSCRQTSRDQKTSLKTATVDSSGDPMKAALVNKIRRLQKAGKDEKVAWAAFCASQEGNNRDPARYPLDVLQEFVQAHCSSDSPIEQGGFGDKLASPKSQEIELSDHNSEDKPKGPKMTNEEFLRYKVRTELAGALAELRLSHDVKEAVSRVAALHVPGPLQSGELCEFFRCVTQEGSEVVRKAGFDLVVNLFDKGHWKPSAVGNGLKIFTDKVCADLKKDVPALPKILCEELCPLLQPLAKRGWLTAHHLKALGEI